MDGPSDLVRGPRRADGQSIGACISCAELTALRHLLGALLDSLLQLEGDLRLKDVAYLTPEQSIPLPEIVERWRQMLGRASSRDVASVVYSN